MSFNYKKFYKYYRNKKNLNFDNNKITTHYYTSDVQTLPPYSSTLPGYYITVNGVRLYLTFKQNKTIMFTMPTFDTSNNIIWDNHYHFGILHDFTKKSRNLFNADVIYFHKTMQDPSKPGKQHKRCYFIDNDDISDVSSMECVEKTIGKMSDEFIDNNDIIIISEIISRPFFGIRAGGKTIKRKNKKRKYTIKRTRMRLI